MTPSDEFAEGLSQVSLTYQSQLPDLLLLDVIQSVLLVQWHRSASKFTFRLLNTIFAMIARQRCASFSGRL